MTKHAELVADLFHRVLELPDEQRESFLREHCAGQRGLRSELDRLLQADRALQGDFLEQRAAAFDGAFLSNGTTLGRYTIIDRLGQGGMGTVYAARQESPAREVALKVIRSDRLSSDVLRRFHHEAEILGSLQHPGIAQVYESGTAEARTPDGARFQEPYLAMEFVHGMPLREFVRSRNLDTRARMALLARICDAVQHAHLRGVIHRDLKPGNVLVVDDETDSGLEEQALVGVGQPKILDFGIARVIGSGGEAATRQTKAGDLLGTLAYMSPEQVAGPSAEVDMRSDVHALGVMLYELLANQLPLDLTGASVPEALHRIMSEVAPPLGSIDPNLRGDISVIASKALEKEKERRYQSAAELASDVRRALRDEPIEARADSALYLLRRKLRRHRVVLVTGGIALALTIGFATMFASQARQNRLLASRETIANREKDAALQQARRGYLRALGATNEMLRRVGQADLADIPRATQLRRDLLEESALLYSALLSEHPEDALLRREAAVGFRWQGRLRGDLGELGLAADALGSAVELLEQLNREDPGDVNILNQLAPCANDYGKLLGTLGRESESRKIHRRAGRAFTDLAEALEAEGMDTSSLWAARMYVAASLANTGASLSRAMQLVAAKEVLEEARGQLEALLRQRPTSVEGRVHLANCSITLSGVAYFQKNAENAREAAKAALSLCMDLIVESPSTPRNRALASRAWFNLSLAHFLDGRKNDEQDALQESFMLTDELAEEYPKVITYQVNRIRSLAQLGASVCGPKRYDESEEMLGEAVLYAEELMVKRPLDPTVMEIRVRALLELGQHLNCAKNFAAAVRPLRIALLGAKELLQGWPDYNPTGRDGAGCASELSKTLFALRQLDEARALAEEAVALTDVAESVQREYTLTSRLLSLARIAAAQDDHGQAAQACTRIAGLRATEETYRSAALILNDCSINAETNTALAEDFARDAKALMALARGDGFKDRARLPSAEQDGTGNP